MVITYDSTTNREYQQLVTNELVTFEKELVEVQNFRKIIDHSRGICRIHPDLDEPSTHTLVPCWMPKPLPPRNQCTGCQPYTPPPPNLIKKI